MYLMGPATVENHNWNVNKLMNPLTNDWDLDVIRKNLPMYEETIRKLIPSTLEMKDERVWFPNASGVFSTKSGYVIAKLCNGEQSDRTFNWKKCIWQLEVSPKIKHFLWKSNNKTLPVGAILERRGINVAPTCKRCGSYETELHLLLECPFAAKAWELAPCIYKPNQREISSVADIIQSCSKMISLPLLGLGSTPIYPWIIWILWNNRNKLLFENKAFIEEGSILKAIQDPKAWKAAHKPVAEPSLPHHAVPTFIMHPVNSYTWSSFSDAAWDASMGLRWQLPDSVEPVQKALLLTGALLPRPL